MGVVGWSWAALHKETLLRCPADFPALDGPRSSVCLAIPSQDRLPCASLPISQGDCEARGCCYDPRDRVKPCYFGNTARCTPDGQLSIAVSRDVTLPPVVLDSVQLASGHSTGCVPVLTNNVFAAYQFPLSVCGAAFQMTADQAIYEKELVASRDVKTGSLGSVTRDSTFRLHVQCTYSISGSSIPLSVQVFTLPRLPAVSQPGPLSLELHVASDGSCTSYCTDSDYPVVKTLRDPVYAEVFLHCSASVCHQSVKESCIPTCPSRVSKWGNRSAQHPFQEGTSHASSKGPVIFLQHELGQDTAKDGLWHPCAPLGAFIGLSLPTGAAVHAAAPWALGFAAVAAGTALWVVLVVSVLWQRKVSAMP
ncbi:unnamed protein product [Coccothraustes coccothraustes]